MTEIQAPTEKENSSQAPRNAASWAQPVERMSVGALPADALNLNVEGRRPTSPLQGFGQMWQKTYRIRLQGSQVAPTEIIKTWKANFGQFWPKGNRFFGASGGLQPGQVAVLNLAAPGGAVMPTGVRVIYADDESFSFMTPQGHMFAGLITFSAYDEGGAPVVQIQALIRASDPAMETAFRLGFGHKKEDEFWRDTLLNLARHFGASGEVTQTRVCVDKKVQWSEAKNIWHNAAIRGALYTPVYLARRLFGRRQSEATRQA
jgi:hypothetical protein